MNDQDQKQLGKTLWGIADQLRGAMNADDFRDYMLSFLFLRYLSDNYEAAAKKELGQDYPKLERRRPPCAAGASGMPTTRTTWPISRSRCAARCITSSSRDHLWSSIANLARTQNGELLNTLQAGFKYIENGILREHLPGPVLRDQPGLGQARQEVRRPQRQALHHHQEDRRRAGGVLHRHRHAGRCL